jgi:Putative transposase of IS4/5 family (DUF4096)
LRYPSELTDEEWALVEPLIAPARRGGNRRHVVVREVVNGLMYILSTGVSVAGDRQGPAVAPSLSYRLATRFSDHAPPPSGPERGDFVPWPL